MYILQFKHSVIFAEVRQVPVLLKFYKNKIVCIFLTLCLDNK